MIKQIFKWFHKVIIKCLGRCEKCGAVSQSLCEDCLKERGLTELLPFYESHRH
jgi:hypothetical protein